MRAFLSLNVQPTIGTPHCDAFLEILIDDPLSDRNVMKIHRLISTVLLAFPIVAFAQSSLENPQPNSTQSGIGMFSGWTCGTGRIEVAINGSRQLAAAGTGRGDTAGVCGRTDTGFGLLFNFNNLGTGRHTAQIFVNGVAQGAPTAFNVVAPAGEFLRGLSATAQVQNFPAAGQTTTLVWQESQQNFAVQSVTTSSGGFAFAGTYPCVGVGATDNAQGQIVIDAAGGAVVNMTSPISVARARSPHKAQSTQPAWFSGNSP